ncbi:MAG: ABC transporter permease [Bacilli bacterium]|jgi:putative tryptophan/tyrosine transport system permease protein
MNWNAIGYFLLSDVPVQGLIWAIFALGVFVTYRILDVADLSVEGVFPLAAILSIGAINLGVDPLLSLLISVVAGMAVGFLNGVLHIYLKIPSLLSGIIIMISLYTVNVVLSSGNISINSGKQTIFTIFNQLINNRILSQIIILFLFVAVIFVVVYWFFGTEYGLSLRASGKNKTMSKANGINTHNRYIVGMIIATAFIALAGGLWGQTSKATATDSGKGTIVIGLAIVFLGEVIFGRKLNFKKSLISIVLGSFIYWLIMDIIYSIPGFNTNYTFLIQAVFITIVVAAPRIKKLFAHMQRHKNSEEESEVTKI